MRPGSFDSCSEPARSCAVGGFVRTVLDSAAMSRRLFLPSRPRPLARRALALAVSLGLVAGVIAAPVAAQDLPRCGDERSFDCVLPDWSEAEQQDLPSLFGPLEGTVWIEDEVGDVSPDGLDIIAVGLAEVDVREAPAVRRSDDQDHLLKVGTAKKAVRDGRNVLVRVVLDRPLDQVTGGHASVHVATDIDGSRRNDSPTAVTAPSHPFAGSQDVYSTTWAATTGKTRLLRSDLAKGWYKSKGPFAAHWAAPNVLDVLIAPRAFGDEFRVVTHVAGPDGGYDAVGVGLADIPASGRLGLVPSCLEGSVTDEAFVVPRLVENGQTLRDVEAPASWRGGVRLPLDEGTRSALEAVIDAADEDGDGRIAIPTWVNLFEDGVVIRQRSELEVGLEGDGALLALELGLTRRGFNVLRDFEPELTDDDVFDAWLERATDAILEAVPPFRSTKRAGLVAGEGIGACIPWLVPPPEAVDSEAPEPTTDAAAADA